MWLWQRIKACLAEQYEHANGHVRSMFPCAWIPVDAQPDSLIIPGAVVMDLCEGAPAVSAERDPEASYDGVSYWWTPGSFEFAGNLIGYAHDVWRETPASSLCLPTPTGTPTVVSLDVSPHSGVLPTC